MMPKFFSIQAMARLRYPVSLSEGYTASSIGSSCPAKGCKRRLDSLPLRRWRIATDDARDGDRTSIDHRIQRCTGVGIEADGIERIAARFHPHLAEYVVLAAVGKARSIDEGFRDGLD